MLNNLSIDLDLPLSRLVSRKLSRILLHYYGDYDDSDGEYDDDGEMLNVYPKKSSKPDRNKADCVDIIDLLRDFRNRGTGVGRGTTRT